MRMFAYVMIFLIALTFVIPNQQTLAQYQWGFIPSHHFKNSRFHQDLNLTMLRLQRLVRFGVQRKVLQNWDYWIRQQVRTHHFH